MKPPQDIISVAVPAPLYHPFDYLPPAGYPAATIRPGMRVRVPFGRTCKIGLVLAQSHHCEINPRRLKQIVEVLDREPLIPADMLSLLQWAAAYYHHPLGETIFSSLPVLLRQGDSPAMTLLCRYRLTAAGQQVDTVTLQKRAPRQAAVLQLLARHPAGLLAAQLQTYDEKWRPALRMLTAKGWVCSEETAAGGINVEEPKTPYHPFRLNESQFHAVSTIKDCLGGFQALLLDGVTGSGKTEVYLHVIEEVIRQDKQALVLIPEIGLTPQLLARFQQHLRVPMAVLHSGLGKRERLHAWLLARAGDIPVVIGTRSAIFTPLQRPGIMIIDEEHDPAFKQQDGFRYHARDLAVMRARRQHFPIVLGSATPALESLHNARLGRYRSLRLQQRAGGAAPPAIKLIDTRSGQQEEGLSRPLLTAMQSHLARDNQVLLFLNRRGYAPTLFCQNCGWIALCQRCDTHMIVHRKQGILACHHCDAHQVLPAQCSQCGSLELQALGQGTQRIEETLERHFPTTEIIRIDRDSTRRKGRLAALLKRVQQGQRQILLGTQMIAKGHHLPHLTLVGIVDADQGLFGADFRATERMGQLILQVAGRSGRATKKGEVLVQTRYPEHPLFAPLIRNDYHTFTALLEEERRSSQLPPFSALALLRAEAVSPQQPLAFLQAVCQQTALQCPPEVQLLGPVPAPMEKRAGRYRAHLLLQSTSRGSLHRVLTYLLQQITAHPLARKVRWSLDVDPQETL